MSMPETHRRHTPQGEAIAHVVEQAANPLSAQEVLDLARRQEAGLGIATVHRHLKRMVEEGRLAKVEIPGEAPRFEPAHRGCHQHFKCESCGRVFDLDPSAIPRPTGLLQGFQVRQQHTLLLGVCEGCQMEL